VRLRGALLYRQPDLHLGQRGDRPTHQLGNFDQLVDARLGQQHNVDRVVGPDQLFDLAGRCILDLDLMTRRFLERRDNLLNGGTHRARGHHLEFCRTRYAIEAGGYRQTSSERRNRLSTHWFPPLNVPVFWNGSVFLEWAGPGSYSAANS